MLGPLLLLAAFICEGIAALAGFNVLVHTPHIVGWVSLGLAFGFAASLVGAGNWWKTP